MGILWRLLFRLLPTRTRPADPSKPVPSDAKIEVIVASDISARDGVGVEIYVDDEMVLEIFRDDTKKTRTVSQFRRDLPLNIVEESIDVFKQKIPWAFMDQNDSTETEGRDNIVIDLDAEIEAGRGAAGLSIGDSIRLLPQPLDRKASELHVGCEFLDFGSVHVWSMHGVIDQIGVRGSYSGRVRGTAIGIGSTLQEVADVLGPIFEDDDDNLVVANLPGLCFETGAWRGERGRETLEENYDAVVTEIYVYLRACET